ncbi:hypothetical protein ACOSQ2_009846 [Xanthoceras sorbifolium]
MRAGDVGTGRERVANVKMKKGSKELQSIDSLIDIIPMDKQNDKTMVTGNTGINSSLEEGEGSCSKVMMEVSGFNMESVSKEISSDQSDLFIAHPKMKSDDMGEVNSPKVKKWKRLAMD